MITLKKAIKKAKKIWGTDKYYCVCESPEYYVVTMDNEQDDSEIIIEKATGRLSNVDIDDIIDDLERI